MSSSNQDNADESMIKLKAEAVAPFRLFRQFIYTAIGAGGGIGTFTAIPQLILSFQSDVDRTNAIQNVIIDVGGVIAAIAFFKIESDNEQKKLAIFKDKQKLMDNRLSITDMLERDNDLAKLPIEIQVSENNENITRIVSLSDLQIKGNQHVIIVTGTSSFVKDSIISARLEGNEIFNSKGTMVVPFIIDDDQLEETPKKGFGSNKQESLMSSPYIARPKQLNVWEAILQKEFDLAISQGTKDVIKQGLVLAIKRNGRVITRGLGLPPWKKIVEELSKE